MRDPRVGYLSAFRGTVAPAKPIQPPSVPSPTGAINSQTVAGQYGLSAGAQAAALRNQAAPMPKEAAWEELGQSPQGKELQRILQQGYATGGLGGIQQAVESAGQDWYELPEYIRTQIMAGARQQGGV